MPVAPADADAVEDSGAEGEFEDFLESDKSADFVSQEEWVGLKKSLGSLAGPRHCEVSCCIGRRDVLSGFVIVKLVE